MDILTEGLWEINVRKDELVLKYKVPRNAWKAYSKLTDDVNHAVFSKETDTELAIETKSGLILHVPEGQNEHVKTELESNLEDIQKTTLFEKDIVIKLYKKAIEVFSAYPDRILRFYITSGKGCPDDVNMDWQVPKDKIKYFSVFWSDVRNAR